MRTQLTFALAAGLLLAGCGDKKAPSAADAGKPAAAKAEMVLDAKNYPKRKAGLWEQTMTSGAGEATQVARFCTDAATEAKMGVLGQSMSQAMCSKIEMKRKLDGSIAFASVCSMSGVGKVTSTGVMTGDFNSAYRMVANSVTEGSSMAQANGPSTMTMDAKWLGPCPAGYRPGDMEVNGMKFNLADTAAKK